MHNSLCVVTINCLSRSLCEALAVQVFTLNLRNITRVAWDMLRFKLIGGSTNPCFAFGRIVSKLDILTIFKKVTKNIDNLLFINRLVLRFEVVTLFVCRFAHSNFNLVWRRFISLASNKSVDVSSGASEELSLLGNMTSVTWQEILLILDVRCRRHNCQLFI